MAETDTQLTQINRNLTLLQKRVNRDLTESLQANETSKPNNESLDLIIDTIQILKTKLEILTVEVLDLKTTIQQAIKTHRQLDPELKRKELKVLDEIDQYLKKWL